MGVLIALSLLVSLACCFALAASGGRRVSFVSPIFLFVSFYVIARLPGDALVAADFEWWRSIVYPTLGIVAMSAGGIAANVAGARTASRALSIPTAAQVVTRSDRELAKLFIFLGLISTVVYFALSGMVPLIHGLGSLFSMNEQVSMHAARRTITLAHRYGDVSYFGQGYLRIFIQHLLPLGVVILVAQWRITKVRNVRIKGMALFALCIVLALLDGRIWPSIQVALVLLVSIVCLEISTAGGLDQLQVLFKVLRRVAIWACLIFAIALFMFYLQSISGRDTGHAYYDALFRRVYSVPTAVLYHLFGTSYDFRWGSTWLNDLSGLLPNSQESFRYEVHEIVTGSAHGFTMAPTIFASMYVNFGAPGLLLASFVLGVVAQFFSIRLAARNNLVAMAAFAYLSARFMIAATQDVASIVVVWIDVVAMIWAFRFYRAIRRSRLTGLENSNA